MENGQEEVGGVTTSVSYQREGQVATLLLEAPDGKPPTLDGEVFKNLEGCLERAGREECRILVIRSASERYFCVGANINALKETDEETIVPWVMEGHRILNLIEDMPMPVVAVVEGYAMGGGLELAMASMAQPEAGLGFIPGWGGTRRLVERVGISKAKYLFYSGQVVDAANALEIGLVDFAGGSAKLDEELGRFTEAVVSNNGNAIGQFKAILNGQRRQARLENATEEALRSKSCLQDVDTKRRLQDFLNKKGIR